MWVQDFRSFLKLREVGDLSYLGFILCLKTMLMFELVEAMRGRLIGPKTWDELLRFMEPKFTVRYCSGTVWVGNGVIHAMDGILMCMRPESAEKCGFTK